jgi:hypothetical protein
MYRASGTWQQFQLQLTNVRVWHCQKIKNKI